MTDPRIETLARNLIGFSCNVQRGENVHFCLRSSAKRTLRGQTRSFGGGTTPCSARLQWALRMHSLT